MDLSHDVTGLFGTQVWALEDEFDAPEYDLVLWDRVLEKALDHQHIRLSERQVDGAEKRCEQWRRRLRERLDLALNGVSAYFKINY